jgi:hypothetical protein
MWDEELRGSRGGAGKFKMCKKRVASLNTGCRIFIAHCYSQLKRRVCQVTSHMKIEKAIFSDFIKALESSPKN